MVLKPSVDIGNSSFCKLTFFVKYASDATDCLSNFNQSSSVFGLHISWVKKKKVQEGELDRGVKGVQEKL